MKKNKKLYIKLIVFVVGLAFIITVANQVSILNQYKIEQSKLDVKIQEATDYQEDLEYQSSQVDTLEFIEQMAREKLDMYYPNEVIYMDIEK